MCVCVCVCVWGGGGGGQASLRDINAGPYVVAEEIKQYEILRRVFIHTEHASQFF